MLRSGSKHGCLCHWWSNRKKISSSKRKNNDSSAFGGAEGQASDIKIQADEILRLRSNLNKILAKNTKQTLKIETDTDRNFFMIFRG